MSYIGPVSADRGAVFGNPVLGNVLSVPECRQTPRYSVAGDFIKKVLNRAGLKR